MGVSLLNYKHGFLLYLLLQMVWFPETQLFQVGGSWINLNFVCAMFFALLYVLKKKKVGKESMTFPYKKPMIAIAISLLLTSISSLSGFTSEFVKACGLIVMDLIIVYIMWETIHKKEDFVFLFKGITIIVLFACIYIFYEKITGNNFILDYKLTCTLNSLSTYRDFQQWDYRGYRCYSIFDHTICACMVFSLYIGLTLILFMKKKRYPFKILSLVTSALCVPAMFFTQQRTGMSMLLISVLAVIDFKKRRFWKLLGFGTFALIIVMPYFSDNLSLLLSMFSSKFAGEVSGSSASMRFDQLAAVFQIMLISPLTGLGENFQSYYTGALATRALGYESLWFEQMAKHGMVGVLAYVLMIYYAVYKIPKKFKSRELLFISLSYWVTYSLTSTPYFRIYFLYAVLFYFIKNSETYLNMKDKNLIIKVTDASDGYK